MRRIHRMESVDTVRRAMWEIECDNGRPVYDIWVSGEAYQIIRAKGEIHELAVSERMITFLGARMHFDRDLPGKSFSFDGGEEL